jgi:hypothetical protein
MILDALLQVSNSQVVTANARSTDTVDLKQDRDIGIGEQVFLIVNVKAVSGTSPTLSVSLQTDDNAAFSSAITLSQTAAATPVAGSQIVVPFPRTNERHLAAFYTVGGTTPSFTIDAHISPVPPPSWQAYPGAIVS